MRSDSAHALERRSRRDRRREYSLAYAISDAELLRAPREMVSIIASVPEDARAAYFSGWERLARQPWGEQPESVFYGREVWSKSLGAAIRLAQVVWRTWPEQEGK